MKRLLRTAPWAAGFTLLFTAATAATAHEDVTAELSGDGATIRADSHAPIGVMGDHRHKAGEWMISYRYMHMFMEDSRDGTDKLSPETIATTVANPFFGTPGQPPTLRVVPLEMTMEMHMFGGMYAPTDWLTLMAMGSYVEKEMDHVTFAGAAGTTRLGEFTTEAKGFGDTKLSGLIELYEYDSHKVHLNAGLSLPTGSVDKTDRVLAPSGATPRLRLPYPMQLGSGTFDLLPGITYSGNAGPWAWGGQYSGVIRVGENDENYSFGDEHRLTAWGSYLWAPWISTSVRLAGQTVGDIDGQDPNIVAPAQTADPDNHGGERWDLGFGITLAGQTGWLRGHRIGLEFQVPVYQHLNGPQLETDWIATLGYQYAF